MPSTVAVALLSFSTTTAASTSSIARMLERSALRLRDPAVWRLCCRRFRRLAALSTSTPGVAAAALVTDVHPDTGVTIIVRSAGSAVTTPGTCAVTTTSTVPPPPIVAFALVSQRERSAVLSMMRELGITVPAVPVIVTVHVDEVAGSRETPTISARSESGRPVAFAGLQASTRACPLSASSPTRLAALATSAESTRSFAQSTATPSSVSTSSCITVRMSAVRGAVYPASVSP